MHNSDGKRPINKKWHMGVKTRTSGDIKSLLM